jgi:small subunit ribosomal protein S4
MKEEGGLINKYGLKNRREVWRANFAISKIRNLAKTLITAKPEEQTQFVERQKEKGFDVKTIAEVLGLSKEDYLKRRLQSVVVRKGFAKTYNQARQLITHKHITIEGNIINSPSHLTTLKEESTIECLKMIAGKTGPISDEEKKLLKQLNKEVIEEKVE